jgi:caffeoyl-CoA O-methyltransferase
MSVMVSKPEDYFGRWVPDRSDLLLAMESEAKEQAIPIVGPSVGQLLYLLAKLTDARRIIELGTATGYSAIFLGNACRETDGRLATFEIDPAMARRAADHIEKAGLDRWVSVQCRDALEGLASMDYSADMIFMDIEKIDYERALPLCKQRLLPNGLLVVDNTGFRDAHGFNRAIYEDPEWESVNLWAFLPGHSPAYDGLCIALKKPEGPRSGVAKGLQ